MPLDGNLAAGILKARSVLPDMAPEFLSLIAMAAEYWHVPQNHAEIAAMTDAGHGDGLARAVEKGLSESNHNIYWWRQALETAAITGDAAWLARLIPPRGAGTPPALDALRCWFAGVAMWLGADYGRALEHFAAAPVKWPGLAEMIGHCLRRLGRAEKALPLWMDIARARPWHVSLLKTMAAMAMKHERPLAAVPARTAVLLYSWNKAEDLNAALEALSASVADMAALICLDNGSTDATGEVTRAWADRLGRDFFKTVSLPVNVGAAAARNWLASLPETRACEYAAYLDDDACVPPDWLRHLFRGVELYPKSSAYGIRVVDARAPFMVQSGPLHLTPLFAPLPGREPLPGQPAGGEEGGESAEAAFSPYLAYGEPFHVGGPQGLGFSLADLGQFDFIGPCVSVTGCCHMFRTRALAERGGFSLALSPSQYDDLEFDLRAAAGGELACHNGFCSALHFKRTGGPAQLKGPSFGNALGNKHKLRGLYDAARITAMAAMEAAFLEEDLLRSLENLE